MNWIKRNIPLIALFVIFLALVGVGVWALLGAMKSEENGRKNYQTNLNLRKELTTPRGGDWIFPSQENRLLLVKNEQTLSALVGRFAMVLGQNPHNFKVMPSNDFPGHASAVVKSLRESASLANIVTPPNFMFGFHYYVTESVFPNQDNTARLLQQLNTVQYLTNTLCKAHVQTFDYVYMHEPQGESAKKAGANAAPPNPPEILPPSSTVIVRRDPAYDYELVPFEIGFQCDTESLRSVLNQLAQSEPFIVISQVSVTTLRGEPRLIPPYGEAFLFGEDKLTVTIKLYLRSSPIIQELKEAQGP